MMNIKIFVALFLPSIMLAACPGNYAVKADKDNAQDNREVYQGYRWEI